MRLLLVTVLSKNNPQQGSTQWKLAKCFILPLASSDPDKRRQEVFETFSEKIIWKIIESMSCNYIICLYVLSPCSVNKMWIAVVLCCPRSWSSEIFYVFECCQLKHAEKIFSEWSLNYDVVLLWSVKRLLWCILETVDRN